MAGDWIKMRNNLDSDPRVIEMAVQLGLSELHVVGCLWKLWAWADQHTIDGNAIRVTDVTLDRFTGVTGFATSMRQVGWLEGESGDLCFPRFAEHNGQTAKKRGETAKRVKKHRNANSVTNVTQSALPEKRREEKRRSNSDGARIGSAVPPAPKPSGLAEVVGYAESRNCDPREAEKFFDHFTANGWKVGGKAPMKDWRAAFRNWCRNAPAMARTGQARGSPAQDREQRTMQAMREFSEGS